MKTRLSILFAVLFPFLTSVAQEIPEALKVFGERQVTGRNEIVFVDGYAFVIVESVVESGLSHQDKVHKQLSETMKLIQDYCLAEQSALKSPFAEGLAQALQIRPSFKMPKLPCNVVKNETRGGRMVYITAFQQDDLEKLKSQYSAMSGEFSFEEWQACLRSFRQKAMADENRFDSFLALLGFPERILASKSGIVTQAPDVNLQELYSTLATWSPDKNSVFKSKKVLQAAPGFSPALLVLATEEEKNGNHWKAWAMRINSQLVLKKTEELQELCAAAGTEDYGTLLKNFLAQSSDKVKLDQSLWKYFGHLETYEGKKLANDVRKAYDEQRFLEGVVVANQLLRATPDSPEAIALLAEGYLQLGLERLADGAYWYLVSLEDVPSAIGQQAAQYLKQRFAISLKP